MINVSKVEGIQTFLRQHIEERVQLRRLGSRHDGTHVLTGLEGVPEVGPGGELPVGGGRGDVASAVCGVQGPLWGAVCG